MKMILYTTFFFHMKRQVICKMIIFVYITRATIVRYDMQKVLEHFLITKNSTNKNFNRQNKKFATKNDR